MLNPARICVGRRRCVRLRTMSRNSCDVGTGWMSFHVVFMAGDKLRGGRRLLLSVVGDTKKLVFWENFSIFTASLQSYRLTERKSTPRHEFLVWQDDDGIPFSLFSSSSPSLLSFFFFSFSLFLFNDSFSRSLQSLSTSSNHGFYSRPHAVQGGIPASCYQWRRART
jgi:hypothetical protein